MKNPDSRRRPTGATLALCLLAGFCLLFALTFGGLDFGLKTEAAGSNPAGSGPAGSGPAGSISNGDGPLAFSRAVAEEVIGAMVDALVKGDRAAFLAQLDPEAASTDDLSEFSEPNRQLFASGIQWEVQETSTDPPWAVVSMSGKGWSLLYRMSFRALGDRWVMTASNPVQVVAEGEYELDVTITPEDQNLKVTGSYTFRLNRSVPSLSLSLSHGLAISALALDGQDLLTSLTEQASGDIGVVSIPLVGNVTGRKRLSFTYSGPMAVRSQYGWYSDYIGPEGAYVRYGSGWFPRFPSDPWDTLTRARITFHVPLDWTVASVGEEISEESDPSEHTITFLSKETDILSFTAGPYRVTTSTAGGVPISVFTLPANNTDPDSVMKMARDAVEIEQAILGSYPSRSLTLAETPDTNASGHGDIGLLILAPPKRAQVYDEFIAHELAHQWFGHAVHPPVGGTGSWWLREGLSNYVAALYLERKHGRQELLNALGRFEEKYLAAKKRSAEPEPNLLLGGSSSPLAEAVTYNKGAWVFHQLRLFVGDDAFFSLLKDVVSRYSGKFMTLDDFFSMVTEKGGVAATDFLKTWLTKVGQLDLALENVNQSRNNDRTYRTTFKLGNRGDLPAPPTPVRLDYYGGSLTSVTRPGVPSIWDTPGLVWRIEIDPGHEVWDQDRQNNLLILHASPRTRLAIWLSGAVVALIATLLAIETPRAMVFRIPRAFRRSSIHGAPPDK